MVLQMSSLNLHLWSQTNFMLLQLLNGSLGCQFICLQNCMPCFVLLLLSYWACQNRYRSYFDFCFVLCLPLTNIFPPNMYNGGWGRVSAFNLFMHRCQVYVAFRWFVLISFLMLHDLYWVCLLCMACALLAEFDFFHQFALVCYIMGHNIFLNFSLPLLESKLWPINVSLIVFTVHCLWWMMYFLGYNLCKNVLQCPWWFLNC